MRFFVKIASGLWIGVSTATNWLRGLISGLAVGIICLVGLSFVDFGCVLDTFISKEQRELQKEAYKAEQEQAEKSRTYYERHPEEDPNFIRRDSPLNQALTNKGNNADETSKEGLKGDSIQQPNESLKQ